MIHMCPDLGGFNLLKQLGAAYVSKESYAYGGSRDLGGFKLPRGVQVPEVQVNYIMGLHTYTRTKNGIRKVP